MNLNKVMLIGRLGKDPEIRYTKAGDAVANFTMATTDTWKDRQGNRQERTEWHTIVAWRQLADFVQNFLKKGRLIYVEGKLQTRDWMDQQNVKHYRTEVVANTINFMEPRPDGERAQQGGGGARQQQPSADNYQQDAGPPPEDAPFAEDDIPF